jgi:two-component system NtrC family sensor kinase
MNLIEFIKSSLARKLIVSLIMIIIIGGSISAYILISKARDNLIDNAIEYTASHSELVKKSTRYSMLMFQRDAIQQIIQSIGAKKDINRIRIFDSRGKVFYSSDRQELGKNVDSSSFVCIGCHTDPGRPLETLIHEKRYSINRDEQGTRVLTYVSPIFNEPSCHTAACHAHSPEQRVLGVLETDFSLHSVDQSIRELIIESTLYTAVFMVIGAVFLYFILRRLVVKPVSILSDAMEKVKKGDLSQTITIRSGDEMSMLASSFNAMTGDLAIAREKMEKWTQSLEDEVARKSGELKKSQDRLIQAEKLASLGRLTSDIAHEIRFREA